jgi:hypothetical protein
MFSTTTVVRTAQDMSKYVYISVKVLDHKHNFMILDLLDFGWGGVQLALINKLVYVNWAGGPFY